MSEKIEITQELIDSVVSSKVKGRPFNDLPPGQQMLVLVEARKNEAKDTSEVT